MKTCGKPYHGTLGIVVNCSEETPCRDCLLIEVGRLEYMVQSLQGELARPRSAPVSVEVPDLLQCDWACSDSLRPVWEDGWRKAIASLPPHPDMVVVSREEGEIHGTPEDLAAIAEGAGWEWIRSPIGGKILVDYMADALRSQRAAEWNSSHHVPN